MRCKPLSIAVWLLSATVTPRCFASAVNRRSDCRYCGTSAAVRGGVVPPTLGAEVMVARAAAAGERNGFGNVTVGLHPGASTADRARAIATSLADARRRAADPRWALLRSAEDRVPAVLLRLGVRAADLSVAPATLSGNTVVSSVHRGPADLRLCGGEVVFSAGFPTVSPAMGLTHGVIGLGDRLTVSVTATAAALPDPDRYLAGLDGALDAVAALSG